HAWARRRHAPRTACCTRDYALGPIARRGATAAVSPCRGVSGRVRPAVAGPGHATTNRYHQPVISRRHPPNIRVANPANAWMKSPERGGCVLLAVLVIVVLLSLAAFQYSELMFAEYRAADSSWKAVEARAAAESGIHYAAAMLSNPDAFSGKLGSN